MLESVRSLACANQVVPLWKVLGLLHLQMQGTSNERPHRCMAVAQPWPSPKELEVLSLCTLIAKEVSKPCNFSSEQQETCKPRSDALEAVKVLANHKNIAVTPAKLHAAINNSEAGHMVGL